MNATVTSQCQSGHLHSVCNCCCCHCCCCHCCCGRRWHVPGCHWLGGVCATHTQPRAQHVRSLPTGHTNPTRFPANADVHTAVPVKACNCSSLPCLNCCCWLTLRLRPVSPLKLAKPCLCFAQPSIRACACPDCVGCCAVCSCCSVQRRLLLFVVCCMAHT
jgi:hypothetical protein